MTRRHDLKQKDKAFSCRLPFQTSHPYASHFLSAIVSYIDLLDKKNPIGWNKLIRNSHYHECSNGQFLMCQLLLTRLVSRFTQQTPQTFSTQHWSQQVLSKFDQNIAFSSRNQWIWKHLFSRSSYIYPFWFYPKDGIWVKNVCDTHYRSLCW